MKRNLENESKDNEFRQYTYRIDGIVRQFLLKRIENLLIEENEVLEIGSHDGYMTELLLQFIDHITVLEPVKELTDLVKKKFGNCVTVENGTIQSNNINRKFNLILLVHVLEHLANPIDELRSLKNLLNDNGSIVVMVPNADAVSRRIAVKMGLLESVDSVTEGEMLQGHQRTYTMSELIRHSTSAGYRIENRGGILYKPFANFQFDAALKNEIISDDYISALEELAKEDFTGTSSLYVILKKE